MPNITKPLKTQYGTVYDNLGNATEEANGTGEYKPTYASKEVEDYTPTNGTQIIDTAPTTDKIASIEEAGRPTYTGKYDEQIAALLDKIYNRGEFSYDFNVDPMYRQYADQYTQQGKQAMMDTMGQANAMTGGYGNTYSQMVGQQQYNNYLQSLNDKIPDLYQLAAARYDTETQNQYNKLSQFNTQDGIDYSRFRDDMGDWESDRSYYYNKWFDILNNNNAVTEMYQNYHQLDPNYATKTVRYQTGTQLDQHTQDVAGIVATLAGTQFDSQAAFNAALQKEATRQGVQLNNTKASTGGAGNNGDNNMAWDMYKAVNK